MHTPRALLALLLLAPLPARAQTTQAQAAAPQMTLEPLVVPEENAAVLRAQDTLRAGAALVAKEADGQVHGIGFGTSRYALGALQFRNAQVVYKTTAEGDRAHVGYTFQVKAGEGSAAPWINIAVNRRGRIANRLFSGADSVFAQASPDLSSQSLQRIAQRDRKSGQALDLVSAWNARRQAKLGGTKPLVVKMPKPGAKR